MNARRLGGLLLLVAACSGGRIPDDPDNCLTCHSGIEQAHPGIDMGQCTICHGGDPDAKDIEGAHVAVPSNWAEVRGDGLPPAPPGYIKDFAPAQLATCHTPWLIEPPSKLSWKTG